MEPVMDCVNFDSWLNQMMDDRPLALGALGPDQESHLATCEPCRATWSGTLVLHQAIASWAPPPPASAASMLRLYELRVPIKPNRPRFSPIYRIALPLSAAAALLLIWVGAYSTKVNDRAMMQRSAPLKLVALTVSRPPLGRAIQEATRATLDVAREVSAPVARIGREALNLEDLGAEPPALEDDPILTTGASGVELIESLGKSVNEGVKPLSGSARHAFSFLLGPPANPEPPAAVRDRATR